MLITLANRLSHKGHKMVISSIYLGKDEFGQYIYIYETIDKFYKRMVEASKTERSLIRQPSNTIKYMKMLSIRDPNKYKTKQNYK